VRLIEDQRDSAFRDEVQRFVRENLPADLRDKVQRHQFLDRHDRQAWQKILHARGWGAPSWPVAFGGTGWNAAQRAIFEEACEQAGAPAQVGFGLKLVAPVIQVFGSPRQQVQHLPGILDGSVWWAQGYSEPGAGSDLAALKTRAVRSTDAQGAHFVVHGQKTWTSWAQWADWIFCLVRTDPDAKFQQGISFLLIDMKTPGITVRPIEMLDGGYEVNEVWFEQVRVPIENLIGEENQGWTYAKYLLDNERTGVAEIAASSAALHRVKRLARQAPGHDGKPLLHDVRFRDRVAQLEIDLMALDFTRRKFVGAGNKLGPEASILKIRGSQISQDIAELCMQTLGLEAAAEPLDETIVREGRITAQYLNFRKKTIYGGATEVQNNIIAKRILGL
jgi:alkylation response protein AidB-like acyl-CoA dehydrogenase